MEVQKKWPRRLHALGPMYQVAGRFFGARWPSRWPSPAELTRLLPQNAGSAAGRPLVFEVAAPAPPDALAYERLICETGRIPLRPGSWHDLFNALAWCMFPHAKAAINAMHAAAEQPRRDPRRDALTLLDECGVLILATDGGIADLNRDHAWRSLFVTRRGEWHRTIRPLLFGHGLMEQCLQPYLGLTAKALHRQVTAEFLELPVAEQLARTDHWLAQQVVSIDRPAVFSALPVLGIPGWDPRNLDPSFYDDASYFRPRRREMPHAGDGTAGPQPGGQDRGRPARK